MRPLGAVPPPLFLIAGMATTQVGASIAKGLFDDLGPAGTVDFKTGRHGRIISILPQQDS